MVGLHVMVPLEACVHCAAAMRLFTDQFCAMGFWTPNRGAPVVLTKL
jgi:hypothetical protein